MVWHPFEIVNAVEAGLRGAAGGADLEQAVYSIDALDELGLHPVIERGLKGAGFGVWREQRYPSQRTGKRGSEGRRCDMVLTEDGRLLAELEPEPTLFDPPDAVALEDAYWLEIKTVAQHTTEGPFPHYARELLSPVAQDIKKLYGDGKIAHAGLLLVLFNEDQRTAEHDIVAWYNRCRAKLVPVLSPVTRGFALRDRLGNGWVSVSLFPVEKLRSE